MDYTTLGRTGLRVSVAGLGAGGHSRLGQAYGASRAESVAVVKRALDLGINFIDTAIVYGTEDLVGEGIRGHRDKVVLSSKALVRQDRAESALISAADFTRRLEQSLARLGTDYIDIYSLHGLMLDEIDHARWVILPALLEARDAGKIRFVGLTERFIVDTAHVMLEEALKDDVWDVVMVGFNLLNPSARTRVFPVTRQKRIGVQNMFAVRRALSDTKALQEALAQAHAAGQLDLGALDRRDPLGFLRAHATSLIEAAYRFCRHEPGVDVVLTGTGKIDHLEANVTAINGPPLPPTALEQLASLFGKVDCISGN
jgi:aryl-alcohol dehydrogenase-like predicted oxidoreductase